MTHKDIIKKIYEDNKDTLESEQQVERVLNATFMLFRRYLLKGFQFTLPGLFIVKENKTSYNIKRIKRYMWNVRCRVGMRKYRSWNKKIMDDDFV